MDSQNRKYVTAASLVDAQNIKFKFEDDWHVYVLDDAKFFNDGVTIRYHVEGDPLHKHSSQMGRNDHLILITRA